MPRATQAGPSQSRATRARAQAEADAAEAESTEEEGVRPSGTQGGGGSGKNAAEKAKTSMGPSAFNKKVSSLIRLLLFHNHTRTPLRRDEINKRIIEDKKAYAVFPLLMSEAVDSLKENFGMDVVELRGKSGDLPAGIELAGGAGKKRRREDDDGEDEPATAVAKKAAIPSTKSYILRSSLPSTLLPHLCLPQPLFEPVPTDAPRRGANSRQRQRDQDATNDGDGDVREIEGDCGAILDWRDGDGGTGGGVAFQGMLWVILGMILVHDRSLSDKALHANFKSHLLISPETILPFSTSKSTSPTSATLTFDNLLSLLVKQSYLERVPTDRDPSLRQVGGSTAGNGEYEYRWGSRSEAEIGERAVAEFMAEVNEATFAHANSDEDEDDDDVAQVGPARRRTENGRAAPNNNAGNEAAKMTPKERKLDVMRRVEIGSGGKLGGLTAVVAFGEK